MRKEIILAIILGIILGGVIIFGINLANKSATTSLPNQALPEQNLDEATPTPTLQIISPENNSVSFQDTLTLTGQTLANAWIAIIWEDSETITQSNESGNWQQEISLVGGENIIKITATDGADYQESMNLTIIYTTANIPTSGTAQEIATGSADQVNENLKQRIQEIVKDKTKNTQTNTLIGHTGVITKISDLSLVVKTSSGNLLQVITNDKTDIVRNGQDIKANSLSIDEKIIIIGNLNTEDILSAKRIVTIKNPTPTTERQTIIAPLTNIKVPNLDIKELSVTIPQGLSSKTEGLQNGQVVISIIETDLEDNTHTLLQLRSLLQ